jgi:hypothetical protein
MASQFDKLASSYFVTLAALRKLTLEAELYVARYPYRPGCLVIWVISVFAHLF